MEKIINELEKKLGKVVLSSNQTLIWDTLNQIDYKNKINGYHGEPVCTIRRSISRYEV